MENSPQAYTGQVEVPNVNNIQSGTPQLYQQSTSIQSTNSQLLNGASGAQIVLPAGEPNSHTANAPVNTAQSSYLGWIILFGAVLIVGVVVAIIRSVSKNTPATTEKEPEVSKPTETKSKPAQSTKVSPSKTEPKSKNKQLNRKKTKKKKK